MGERERARGRESVCCQKRARNREKECTAVNAQAVDLLNVRTLYSHCDRSALSSCQLFVLFVLCVSSGCCFGFGLSVSSAFAVCQQRKSDD